MLYFDTSFLVPLFIDETSTAKVERFLGQRPAENLAVSDWTRIEFSSAIARHVRIGHVSVEAASVIETGFEALVAASFVVISPAPPDFDTARQYLRRYETGLRAGDALHLAIASNNGAEAIYSLDRGVLKAGERLRLPVKFGI